MFFTNDHAVKAPLQRQQKAKKELRLQVPCEGQSISVLSSNFHAMSFGKALNITVPGRPASARLHRLGLGALDLRNLHPVSMRELARWAEKLWQEWAPLGPPRP